jgi:hypothetical protein
MSKTAAVVLDAWKLPIFKNHLDAAGFKYEEPIPFTDGTLLLNVHFEWVHQLQPIVKAAQHECAAQRHIELGGRQSGKTTRAMLDAPRDAVFVWCNHHLDYPKRLAHHLGREDLKIVSPEWIIDRQWMGLHLTAIQLDPDTNFSTETERERLHEAQSRVRSQPVKS